MELRIFIYLFILLLIKNMYVNTVSVPGSIRLYHVSLAFQCVYGRSDERSENGDGEEGREWVLPALVCADDLVLWG